MRNFFFLALMVVVILVAGVYMTLTRPKNVILDSQPSRPSPTGQASPVSAPKITPADTSITVPSGYTLGYFAQNLGSARDLQFSPGGTLLVSDPNDGTVLALPDKNGDGVADQVVTVISGLNHPHGLAFYGGKLFIAEVDRVV